MLLPRIELGPRADEGGQFCARDLLFTRQGGQCYSLAFVAASSVMGSAFIVNAGIPVCGNGEA